MKPETKQADASREGFARILALFQKKNALFLAGIVGILLIFLSDILFSGTKKTDTTVQTQPAGSVQAQADTYVQDMEKRLADMLATVQGAGEVRVMITLESAGETVYAQNEKNSTETSTTQDGILNRKSLYENEHMLVDGTNGKQPLVETQLSPQVQGVAVVCQGGDDITVVSRITELVSVVLGLSTNRICVTKMI